jgi:hypothetical protein
MAWHLQLGFDERIMQKVDSRQLDRQKFVFSTLTLMLMAIGSLVFFSSLVYSIILFHNWLVALAIGLFLSLVVFNIYRFLIVSSVNAGYTGLATFLKNHELAYLEHLNNEEDFSSFSEAQIQHLVNSRKDYLRSLFPLSESSTNTANLGFWTMLVRVSMIAIIALVFATGLELFLFRGPINETLDAVKWLLAKDQPDSYLLLEVLTPREGQGFIWLNSNSLLYLIQVITAALGHWKLVLDVFFLLFFLMPLFLIFRSREILFGSYVQELALHEIAISHYHFLKTQKFCNQISEDILKANNEWVYNQKVNER